MEQKNTNWNTNSSPQERTKGTSRFLKKSIILDPISIILFITVVISIFFLVRYSRMNSLQIKEIERLRERINQASVATVGDAVPPLQVIDLQGKASVINYNDAKKHLLFIFTIHCEFCKQDFPIWDELTGKLISKSHNYAVNGISIDTIEDVKANLEQYRNLLTVTVVTSDPNFIRTYRAAAFPLIMIVGDQGVIEWIHKGEITPKQVQEIEERLR